MAEEPGYLSIIIPARNDADALCRTLDRLPILAGRAAVEIIVAASGDPEGTERAVAGRARVIWPGGSTRARLMNAGAAVATGQTLLFLHADSLPPVNFADMVITAFADGHASGGAFEHRFTEAGLSLCVISWINRMRYRLTGNYYGDQGIFVRAAVFQRLGGYRNLHLLEDLEFSQRLRRVGCTVLIRAPMYTSGRRFLARGPWRTFSFIVWILFCRTLGLDTSGMPCAGGVRRITLPAARGLGAAWRRMR